MSFSDFNLTKEFIQSIEAAGFKSPTELQSKLIPLIAEKKSVLIWSQSASGKTGAFLIPAMNYILENPAPEKRGARILILTSRRDRVSQINHTLKRLSANVMMRFGFIVSGRPYQTQMRLMRRPLDIMIATPGRLNDLMNNGKADFSKLEMLIIDDLSSIFHKNLQQLITSILKQAGSECSSITFTQDDEDIASYTKSLFPDAVEIYIDDTDEKIETANNKVPEVNTKPKKQSKNHKAIDASKLMQQQVHIADDYTHKIAMLDHLLDEFSSEPTLIYTATNKSAKTLQENLSNHGHAAELHSDELSDCDICIYSDQAKTSISDEELSKMDKHIIHFDLPHKIENYLRRLNRHEQQRDEPTLLMVDGYNYNELKNLEKLLGKSLKQITIPGLDPLKPFVNLSKPKPARKNNKNHPHKNKAKTNTNKKNKNTRQERNANKQKSSNDKNKRRQHKGPFGRLNGGTHRKNNNRHKKVGVSTRGTEAPKSDRSWQSDFAQPKERTSESKPVAIRYSKKRLISDDNIEDI